MTGTLTYDSALADSDASSSIGMYAPVRSLTFTLGSYTATFVNGTGFVRVTNGPSDQLALRGDVTGPTVNFFKPFNLSFSFVDSTGQVFSSDALPSAFDSSQFTLSQFLFTFTNRANPYDLTSSGTNFTGVSGTLSGSAVAADAVPAPEPATLALLGGGLASIALRLRRKQRSAARRGDAASRR